MSDAQTDQVTRIEVRFGVDVPTEEVDAALKTLEALRPGSVEYAVAWDELKERYNYFMGRLEGECAAYMNIAREQARQRFGM